MGLARLPSGTTEREKVIIIGDKQFGKGEKSVVDSLTTPVNGKTLDGYYKRLKRGIKFFMPNGELFAYLCANEPWHCFFVNAFMFEGKVHYQFSTGQNTEARLGIADMKHSEEIDLANAIWKASNQSVPVPAAA